MKIRITNTYKSPGLNIRDDMLPKLHHIPNHATVVEARILRTGTAQQSDGPKAQFCDLRVYFIESPLMMYERALFIMRRAKVHQYSQYPDTDRYFVKRAIAAATRRQDETDTQYRQRIIREAEHWAEIMYEPPSDRHSLITAALADGTEILGSPQMRTHFWRPPLMIDGDGDGEIEYTHRDDDWELSE
jgi:hypothetical protein